jgi:hypothetical protein
MDVAIVAAVSPAVAESKPPKPQDKNSRNQHAGLFKGAKHRNKANTPLS